MKKRRIPYLINKIEAGSAIRSICILIMNSIVCQDRRHMLRFLKISGKAEYINSLCKVDPDQQRSLIILPKNNSRVGSNFIEAKSEKVHVRVFTTALHKFVA